MNIHCCSVTDKNYLIPTIVTIGSVCLNNPQSEVDYWLVVDKIGVNDENLVLQLERKFSNLRVHIIQFDNLTFPAYFVDIINKTLIGSYLTTASYGRLFIAKLLPENVEKVLYLDADVLCIGSLKELFNLDMSKCAVAAVLDSSLSESQHAAEIGVTKYINSGVLLINLKLWREKN